MELRPGETPHDALTRVILHERVGHDGLKALLGAKDGKGRELWQKLKDTIPPEELLAIANDPNYSHLKDSPDDLAQEWFARKAESSPHLLQKPGLLRDLWHYFKSVLQNLGSGSKGPSAERQLHDLLRLSRQAALRPAAPAGTPYSTASSTTTSTGATTGLNTTSHTTNGTGDGSSGISTTYLGNYNKTPGASTPARVASSTPLASISESRAQLRLSHNTALKAQTQNPTSSAQGEEISHFVYHENAQTTAPTDSNNDTIQFSIPGKDIPLPWTNAEANRTAKLIEEGEITLKVSSRAIAEELLLRVYQGKGYINTSGSSAMEVKSNKMLFPTGKRGTYHWDDKLDKHGRVQGHGEDNQHGHLPHLQIHTFNGDVIRIFYENKNRN